MRASCPTTLPTAPLSAEQRFVGLHAGRTRFIPYRRDTRMPTVPSTPRAAHDACNLSPCRPTRRPLHPRYATTLVPTATPSYDIRSLAGVPACITSPMPRLRVRPLSFMPRACPDRAQPDCNRTAGGNVAPNFLETEIRIVATVLRAACENDAAWLSSFGPNTRWRRRRRRESVR